MARWWTRRGCVAVLAGVSLAGAGAVAGCGSSSSSASRSASGSSGSSSSSAGGKSASLPAYDGPERRYFGNIVAPNAKPGAGLRFGLLQVNGAASSLLAMQSGVVDQIKKLGGTTITLDAQINPQTQISQFQQLLSQHVNAIIVMPVIDSALTASLKQAQAAHIPVVSFALPANKALPANPYVATSVNSGFDFGDYSIMRYFASQHPGATYALLGSSLPVPQLQYIDQRIKYWGTRLGLKFVGEVDAQADNPTGYAPALQTLFTQHGNADYLVTYNDESAIAASTQAAQKGSRIEIGTGNGGEDVTRQAIAAKRVLAVYFQPWRQMGTTMANAAFAWATKQGKPAKTLVLKSLLVTKSNIGDNLPWAK